MYDKEAPVDDDANPGASFSHMRWIPNADVYLLPEGMEMPV